MLLRIEKRLMSETQVLEKLQKLESAVARLQERIEDLEDLRDLEEAIAENGDKPLIPWEEAKKDLDLE
jgi:hypothetical protein